MGVICFMLFLLLRYIYIYIYILELAYVLSIPYTRIPVCVYFIHAYT